MAANFGRTQSCYQEVPLQTSAPVRDSLAGHLLTPQNAALLLIDYQPAQLAGVRSMDHALLVKTAISTVKAIKNFGVPVVPSTINVASGRGRPWTARSSRGQQRGIGEGGGGRLRARGYRPASMSSEAGKA